MGNWRLKVILKYKMPGVFPFDSKLENTQGAGGGHWVSITNF